MIHYGFSHTDAVDQRNIYQFNYPEINRINFYYWMEEQLSEEDKKRCVAKWNLYIKPHTPAYIIDELSTY